MADAPFVRFVYAYAFIIFDSVDIVGMFADYACICPKS